MTEKNNSDLVEKTSSAVATIFKEVPIYQDALQPAMKQVGKTLETTVKAVNLALTPISATIWGAEKIRDFVEYKVSQKLSNVEPEEIVPPPERLAGPIIEALRFVHESEDLRELFANLLSKAMTKNGQKFAHPSFIEVIKQLSPEEAHIVFKLADKDSYPLIVRRYYSQNGDKVTSLEQRLNNSFYETIREMFFKNIKEIIGLDKEQAFMYLDNLDRLKLIEITSSTETRTKGELGLMIESDRIDKIEFTEYGNNFIKACVK